MTLISWYKVLFYTISNTVALHKAIAPVAVLHNFVHNSQYIVYFLFVKQMMLYNQNNEGWAPTTQNQTSIQAKPP